MSKKSKVIIENKGGKLAIVDKGFVVKKQFEPGFYIVSGQRTPFGTNFHINVDKNVKVPSSKYNPSEKQFPIQEIKNYFSHKSYLIHKELNMNMSYGSILYGKQGTGKTTAGYTIAQQLVKDCNAIVFSVSCYSEIMFIKYVLKELNVPAATMKVFIMDECEYQLRNHESNFKQLLDGKETVEGAFYMFMTNYLDKIPKTILDRPSRIKKTIEFTTINEEETVFEIISGMNETLSKSIKLQKASLRDVTKLLSKDKTLDEIKTKFIEEVYNVSMTNSQIDTLIQEV